MKKKIMIVMTIFFLLLCSSLYASQLTINNTLITKHLTKTQYRMLIITTLNCAILYHKKDDQWGFQRFIFMAENSYLDYYNKFTYEKKRTKEDNQTVAQQQFKQLCISQTQIIQKKIEPQLNKIIDDCSKIKEIRIDS